MMANNLGKRLEGRFVMVRREWFASIPQGEDERERVFLALGGFGCSPDTMGNAVVGEFLVDGERTRVEGFHLEESFATDEQVSAALLERLRRGILPTEEVTKGMRRMECEAEFGEDHDHDDTECDRLLSEMENAAAAAYEDYALNREAEENMLGRPLFPNEY